MKDENNNRATIYDFTGKYDVNDNGCWVWNGAINSEGYPYGKLTLNNKTWFAHRVSYMQSYGEIKPKINVCHKCDNPKCINPEHLFLGTQKDNILDAVKKGRHKHCVFYGQEHPMAKLTKEDVEVIRLDNRLLREIAEEYNISISQTHRIKHNQSWRLK